MLLNAIFVSAASIVLQQNKYLLLSDFLPYNERN